VLEAAENLVYNSIVCVMVGVKRPRITDKHWLYFPEERLVFNRVSFPMNFSPHTTPEGRSSVLAEVTYREGIDVDETKKRVLEGLVDAELLRHDDVVEICEAAAFKYAYVVYDLDHRKNVNIVHSYLEGNRITPMGRFGEWEYYNMDKAILSGKRAAESLST
jgi:UDP-galactopyranose mutase